MSQASDAVSFVDYVRDTDEIVRDASAIIADLQRQLREREVLVWAMVRASGGQLSVPERCLHAGMPAQWRIIKDDANMAITYRIE